MIRAGTTPARSLASVISLPPAVIEVVDGALAFEKAERWQSAAAMRDAVRDAYRTTQGEEISRAPLLGLTSGSSSGARPNLLGATEHEVAASPRAASVEAAPFHGPAAPGLGLSTAKAVSVDPGRDDKQAYRSGRPPRSTAATVAGAAIVLMALSALLLASQWTNASSRSLASGPGAAQTQSNPFAAGSVPAGPLPVPEPTASAAPIGAPPLPSSSGAPSPARLAPSAESPQRPPRVARPLPSSPPSPSPGAAHPSTPYDHM